jgi:hypothetical protein
MSSNSSRPAVEGRGISRRTLVKGAAHGAWVVPAVQVVSAVPAFAVSGCSLSASGTISHNGNNTPQRTLSVSLTVTNSQDTPADVVVTLNFPARYSITASPTAAGTWTIARTGNVITLTRANPGLAGNASETIAFSMTATRNVSSASRDVTVSPSGQRRDGKGPCTTANTSITVTESGTDKL